jgi:23S rRNA (uracil1939-C5)-methyltransferase
LPDQLATKRRRVLEAWGRFPLLDPGLVGEVTPAQPIAGYRSRAKLVVSGTSIGLFAAGSHTVADIPECRVLQPALRSVLNELRARLPLPVPLLAVDLRATRDGVLLGLVVETGTANETVEATAARLTREIPGIAGVAVSHRERAAPMVLGRQLRVLSGPLRVRSDESPYVYAAHGTFAQAHAVQAANIRLHVREALGPSLREQSVLELYAGSGALSLELAAQGARITAVEADPRAVGLLRAAAEEQGLAVTALAEDAARAATRLAEGRERFTCAVLNPPRTGVPPDVRRAVAELAPELIAYVSCSPESLARDLAHLALLGYAAERVTPFDLMPQSAEVETLSQLRRSARPAARVLFEDADLIAVEKAPHEPTTPQGEHEASLLDRVRALPGAAEAVPVHRLDLGTSGVCLFARTPASASGLAAALAQGQKEYAALARGITRPKGTVRRRVPDGGRLRDACTRYKRRAVLGGHSLLSVFPEQGKKHQIRRHLASLGHPVLGDERYGHAASNQHFFARHQLDRTFLHLCAVELELGGVHKRIEVALPGDLEYVLQSLSGGS